MADEIKMRGWRDRCGRALSNLTNAASFLTGPMQMDGNSNVSRQCARSRLVHARGIAPRAVHEIDKMIGALEDMT